MAMDRGNINQVGHDGWASFIDIIQEVVLDQVNEWRTESQDNPTCVQDRDEYKKWEANVPTRDKTEREEHLSKLNVSTTNGSHLSHFRSL